MHHVQPARGCDRIGKLAADLGDLGHRQEGRDRHQHQQRQQRRRDPAMQHQRCAHRGDRQSAEPGRHLQPGGLARQIVQQREAHRLVAPRVRHELVAPPRGGRERHQFGEALDRLGRVRAELAQRTRARWRRGGRCAGVPARASRRHRPGTAAARAPAARRPRPASPAPRRGSAPRRTPARRCGHRSIRSSRRPASPARPGRRSGASAGRPAPARRACDTARCASRRAAGTPCRAPGTIPASAAARRPAPRRAAAPPAAATARSARTAAMISAPSTLTPMKATTRPMPQDTVTASCRRHGRMKPSSVRIVAGQPTSAASCARSRTTAVVSSIGASLGAASSASGASASLRSASCGPISRRYGPSRAISSAWRPLSHDRAVLQHQDAVGVDHAGQAMRQDQRGAAGISRSSACWITASFSASTEDSASSSTRIGASRSSARAMAMRWRWPPDSRAPRSPMTVW